MFKNILISFLIIIYLAMTLIIIVAFDNIHKVDGTNDIYSEYEVIIDFPAGTEYSYKAEIIDTIYSNNGNITNVYVAYPSGVSGAMLLVNFPIVNGVVSYSKPFDIAIFNRYNDTRDYVYNGYVSGNLGFTIQNNEVEVSDNALLNTFRYYLNYDSTIGAFISLWNINTSRKPVLNNDVNILRYVFVDYPDWIGNYFNIIFYFL